MKKILTIALPILIIIAGLAVLYIFVLKDIFDPPPNKVMVQAIDAASAFARDHTEKNENDFMAKFSNRSRQGLEREWRALALDGSPRGSWYDMANGLLNSDGSRPTVIGIVAGAGAEGAGEEEAEEGAELQSVVRIRRDREELDIPFVREEGAWRINIPVHPRPWRGGAAPTGS
jgi:hypothetical protein